MGVVWKARDEETGQIVALKVLREMYAEDPDYLARFERELELEKRIHSQNVVRVLGFGMRDRSPYLVLEYIDGPSLRGLILGHGPYGWSDARNLIFQIAQGLADAHAAGVIHRDLKPSNILMGPGGVPKIADFGISKGLDLTRVTSTSALIGTPAYLAPEGPKDERSDLYSLGVIGYEILTGVVPFEGPSYQDVLLAHLSTAPDLSKLPVEARPLLSWLLAKNPDARPKTAGQLIRALSGMEGIPELGTVQSGMAAGATAQTPPAHVAGPMQPGTTWSLGGAPARMGTPNAQRSGSRASIVLALIGVVAVVAIVGTAAVMSVGRPDSSGPTNEPTPTAFTGGVADSSGQASLMPQATQSAAASAPSVPSGQWLGNVSVPAGVWGNGVAQLNDGRVAIFAVCGNKECLHLATQKTWVFDPRSGKLSDGPSMAIAQLNPAVAVFNNGADVMIAGGRNNSGPIASAEILDLATGAFHPIAAMHSHHDQGTATDIGGGRVLVTGGWTSFSTGTYAATATAEVFDITTGSWTTVKPMSVPRARATATRLQDGEVLVAGGDKLLQEKGTPHKEQVLSSAEIFDPQTNTWHSAGNMSAPRAVHLAVLLPNGDVMVAGGWSNGYESALVSTDVYTPGVGWRTGAMPGPHAQSRLVTLADGRVLVIGGVNANDHATAETDLYDPGPGTWVKTATLPTALYWPAAVALNDGGVVLVGGWNDSDVATGGIQVLHP